MADFTCADATSVLKEMPCSDEGFIIRGAQSLPSAEAISAPISLSGVMIRFIGRLLTEASPVTAEAKSCPARIPEISLAVVPEFPQ